MSQLLHIELANAIVFWLILLCFSPYDFQTFYMPRKIGIYQQNVVLSLSAVLIHLQFPTI